MNDGNFTNTTPQPARPIPADAHLRSVPGNVTWGLIPANAPPVLRITSGQTVHIDTVSQQGITAGIDPVEFFGAAGIDPDRVLDDVKQIYRNVKREPGAGGHVLTGPIYIDGAHPGDMLEVRVLDIEFRIDYGVNNSGPGMGAAPELLTEVARNIIRLDLARGVAKFSRASNCRWRPSWASWPSPRRPHRRPRTPAHPARSAAIWI